MGINLSMQISCGTTFLEPQFDTSMPCGGNRRAASRPGAERSLAALGSISYRNSSLWAAFHRQAARSVSTPNRRRRLALAEPYKSCTDWASQRGGRRRCWRMAAEATERERLLRCPWSLVAGVVSKELRKCSLAGVWRAALSAQVRAFSTCRVGPVRSGQIAQVRHKL